MLTKIAKLSGAFVSFTLAVSIVHEWAYFFAIDLKWLLFFSVSDYLSASLQWLPYSILTFGIGVSFNYFLQNRNHVIDFYAPKLAEINSKEEDPEEALKKNTP